MYVKFNDSCFSRSRDNIRGPKIYNGSRDHDHDHFKVDLSSLCWGIYLCSKYDHSISSAVPEIWLALTKI